MMEPDTLIELIASIPRLGAEVRRLRSLQHEHTLEPNLNTAIEHVCQSMVLLQLWVTEARLRQEASR